MVRINTLSHVFYYGSEYLSYVFLFIWLSIDLLQLVVTHIAPDDIYRWGDWLCEPLISDRYLQLACRQTLQTDVFVVWFAEHTPTCVPASSLYLLRVAVSSPSISTVSYCSSPSTSIALLGTRLCFLLHVRRVFLKTPKLDGWDFKQPSIFKQVRF
jgi:hypothetical protein